MSLDVNGLTQLVQEDTVNTMLEVNQRCEHGKVPLILAVRAAVKALRGKRLDVYQRARAVVQLLLHHGADVHATNVPSGRGALLVAAHFGDAAMLDLLLAAGAQRSADVMREAVRSGSADAVELLLAGGRVEDDVFVDACKRGHARVVRVLLRQLVPGRVLVSRALEACCSRGHVAVLGELLEAVAEVRLERVLNSAVHMGYEDVVVFLLDRGAVVSEEMLLHAVMPGVSVSDAMLRRMVRNVAQVSAYAVARVVATGTMAQLGVLLEEMQTRGQDVEDTSEWIKHAVQGRVQAADKVELLVRHGVRLGEGSGMSLLAAVYQHDARLVRALLRAGADPQRPEVQFALANSTPEMVRLVRSFSDTEGCVALLVGVRQGEQSSVGRFAQHPLFDVNVLRGVAEFVLGERRRAFIVRAARGNSGGGGAGERPLKRTRNC